MFISRKLREENIASYLLYMWHTEDIIRAYSCSLSRIRSEYISRFDYTEEQCAELADWYGNLITMMNREGCREQGHLAINNIVLQEMSELHVRLLQSTKFPVYNAEYYRALPFIVELRQRGAAKDGSETETCLTALYGVMMLRLAKKDVTPSTEHAAKEIATLMSMLSDYYKRSRTEDLFADND